MMYIFRAIFIAILLATADSSCYAADSLAHTYPRAVLVQIRSENNRIAAMIKARDRAGLEEVIHDALQVKQRIILDFTKNYHRCPVYYFIDTNVDLIKQKRFAGVLLDTSGNPVANPVVNASSTDYLVVYYGYRIYQPRPKRMVTDPAKYRVDPEVPPGKGLVVLNDQFLQLAYFYKLDYDGTLYKRKKKNQPFWYESKRFDMEYFPFANMLQENSAEGQYGVRRWNQK